MLRHIFLLAVGVTSASSALLAQTPHGDTSDAHRLLLPAELQWSAGPASLPAGAQVALLEGNPAEPGPFTLRLRLPDDYRIAPHWHPGIEHVTVLSGAFVVGRGERISDHPAKEVTEGGFMLMPPQTAHYAHTRGETVLQLHGVGPWAINYVNPADDPRRRDQ
jgi:mannose-6-phosphate isomerase-like protein (cupin superfamily)